MQTKLTSVSNPQWVNAEHTRIECVITTEQFGDELLPFTADKDDVEPHGRAIFNDIVNGLYGEILEYVPPPVSESIATPSSGNIPQSVL